MAFVVISFIINLDLYYVLKSPFYPINKRAWNYYLFIILFSLSYTIIINAFKLNKLNYNKQIKNYISLIFLLLNIIVSILILIRTKKEGTDNKLIKSVRLNQLGLMSLSTFYLFIHGIDNPNKEKVIADFFKLDHADDVKIILKIFLCFVQFIQFVWIIQEPRV